jgi:hypothetical protein
MAYVSEEFEVDGADIAAVLAWAEATASPDRTYTLYVLVHCDGAAGLVRLAGTATGRDRTPMLTGRMQRPGMSGDTMG